MFGWELHCTFQIDQFWLYSKLRFGRWEKHRPGHTKKVRVNHKHFILELLTSEQLFISFFVVLMKVIWNVDPCPHGDQ